MGITDKMERMFRWLPYIMVAFAIFSIGASFLGFYVEYMRTRSIVPGVHSSVILFPALLSSFYNPLIITALAALIHAANRLYRIKV